MLDYPYFVDVRGGGKNDASPITSDLPQVTVAWASPIVIDTDKNAGRTVTELLKSSPQSWRSTSLDVMPQIDAAGRSAYKSEGEVGAALIGVELEGSFGSFFADKDNPLLADADKEKADADEPAAEKSDADEEADKSVIAGVIDKSPEAARLFLFSSNAFLSDQTLAMIGSAEGTVYGNSLQLIANAVDYSLEDRGLLAIRSRGHFNRTLPPLSEAERSTLEYGNYGIALLALLAIYVLHRSRQTARRARYQQWLAAGDAA